MAWAREQFEARGVGVPSQLTDLASAIDQAIAVPQHACGFEFHHDGSGRVDFQVLADSSKTAFAPAVRLPEWFTPLVQRCTGVGGADAAGAKGSSLAFSAEHCLAFDRSGGEVGLAGIWQRIVFAQDDQPQHARVESWTDQLAAFLAGTSVDAARLRRSASLRHYVDTLGMPNWLGIMSGRGSLLKIMATPRPPAGAYERFFAHPELAAAIDERTGCGAARFGRALAEADGELQSRIILDVDLEADRFPNGFGIEVGPAIRSRSALPASVVNFLADVIGVEQAAVDRAGALMACLPIRHRLMYSLDGLEDLLVPALREDRYTARLSHLKVVVRPDRPPTIKTYVGLMFERGQEHAPA